MNLRRWLQEHSLKLLAIRDTPDAIAGGIAIGIFFWFPPLLGLKTACAILVAWLTRSNILAAVIAITLHDVLVPVMFVIYRWEYCLGFWLLSNPHHWPKRWSHSGWAHSVWMLRPHWTDWKEYLQAFSTIGKPLVLGSFVIGIPAALVSFWATRAIVTRHQRKKDGQGPPPTGG